MYKIIKKSYENAPFSLNEIIRYSGAKIADENLKSLISDCLSECEKEKAVNYEICYTETPLSIKGDIADFSAFTLKSKNLVTALKGCSFALIFACTIGIGIDRLIKKYSAIHPSKALIFQAIGTERVETFTDLFIEEYKKEQKVSTSSRFSAGYGDLSLEAQKEIFNILNPQKHLGLTLNDSLIMSPSKSVTAILGINETCVDNVKPCNCCDKKNCLYRR